MERTFSQRVTWAAANSEYGDRLVEIMKEHTSLARQLSDPKAKINPKPREAMKAKIEALRVERESILERFERVVTGKRDA
ncbi:hypothetical protein PV433_30915 [Paenibacillus sp. GYB004]|uniref:hypothetical protein n=1 Tax=Paenibacillus sp. GYB004 TaxID=2994393 RepID=UPI002F96217E